MKTTYAQHPVMPLDFSNVSRQAMELGDGNSGRGEADTRLMAELDVAFDGRSYWYRQYRYDQLDDALAYARLDGSRPAAMQAAAGDQQHWQESEAPTAATEQLMAELGIGFDGRYFRYDEYRYDRFADAINYAQLTQTRSIMPPMH